MPWVVASFVSTRNFADNLASNRYGVLCDAENFLISRYCIRRFNFARFCFFEAFHIFQNGVCLGIKTCNKTGKRRAKKSNLPNIGLVYAEILSSCPEMVSVNSAR